MKTRNERNVLKEDELLQVSGGTEQIVVPSVDPRPVDPALPVMGR